MFTLQEKTLDLENMMLRLSLQKLITVMGSHQPSVQRYQTVLGQMMIILYLVQASMGKTARKMILSIHHMTLTFYQVLKEKVIGIMKSMLLTQKLPTRHQLLDQEHTQHQ